MFDVSKISLFSGLESEELDVIFKLMRPIELDENTLVIKEGEFSNNLYIVESGELKVYISNSTGSKFYLNTLTKDSYFGEFAFLDSASRTASVITSKLSKLYEIQKKDFSQILRRYPSVYQVMVKNLVGTIRQKDAQIKQLTLKNVYPNLKQYLLDQSTLGFASRKKGNAITAESIAQLIDSQIGIVAYLLSYLEDNKFIDIDADKIYVYKTLPEEII